MSKQEKIVSWLGVMSGVLLSILSAVQSLWSVCESGQGQVKLSVLKQIFNPVVSIECQSGQRPVICPHPESILIPIRGSCLHINPTTIR